MRASLFPLLTALCASALWMPDAAALERAAVVVGIEQVSGFDDTLTIAGAHERAVALGDALKKAGYQRVDVLIGPRATQASIQAAIDGSVAALDPDGTLLWVFEGHGTGGDFGDSQLLAVDHPVKGIWPSGFDVAQVPARLMESMGDRSLIVITDAIHEGEHDGAALIGPVASDWYNPGDRFAVISATGADQVATSGIFGTTLTAGVAGAADTDQNGEVSLGELVGYLRSEVGDGSGGRMHPARAGGLSDEHGVFVVQSVAAAPEPAAAPAAAAAVAPAKKKDLRSTSVRLWVAGGALGTTSVLMYAVKRPSCEPVDAGLSCGETPGYQTYRQIQHVTGLLGGGLVLTGAGLWFMDAGSVSAGPGSVHLHGRF